MLVANVLGMYATIEIFLTSTIFILIYGISHYQEWHIVTYLFRLLLELQVPCPPKLFFFSNITSIILKCCWGQYHLLSLSQFLSLACSAALH